MAAAADGSGQSEAFAAWRMFFEAMGAQSPTVVVLDDLHWADDVLLDFVDGLVDRSAMCRSLSSRPRVPTSSNVVPAGRAEDQRVTIGLDPLSSEHTTALIGAIIDRSLLALDAEALLLERAGGNPLYAQEYVRALMERGAGSTLPETVQGIIAARLDGLSHDEKSLLQDAAVETNFRYGRSPAGRGCRGTPSADTCGATWWNRHSRCRRGPASCGPHPVLWTQGCVQAAALMTAWDQAALASFGLRRPFFLISHSAL